MSASRGGAARQAAPVFAALGDTTRLALVRRLSMDGPLSITRLSEGSGMTRQAITRHLHSLERAGLVRDVRDPDVLREGRGRRTEADQRGQRERGDRDREARRGGKG